MTSRVCSGEPGVHAALAIAAAVAAKCRSPMCRARSIACDHRPLDVASVSASPRLPASNRRSYSASACEFAIGSSEKPVVAALAGLGDEDASTPPPNSNACRSWPGPLGSVPDGSAPVTFCVILPRCFTMACNKPQSIAFDSADSSTPERAVDASTGSSPPRVLASATRSSTIFCRCWLECDRVNGPHTAPSDRRYAPPTPIPCGSKPATRSASL